MNSDPVEIICSYAVCVCVCVLSSQLASQRCSLLLVDRSLDLSAPCLHSGDHLADKMLGLLPALFQGSSDIAINMAPICEGDPQ